MSLLGHQGSFSKIAQTSPLKINEKISKSLIKRDDFLFLIYLKMKQINKKGLCLKDLTKQKRHLETEERKESTKLLNFLSKKKTDRNNEVKDEPEKTNTCGGKDLISSRKVYTELDPGLR